ncbi:pilus assembly PilX N-terminal domain-containing protein [Thermosynechococcus sp. HN-54]|uniref:pilus assembly PilX family protein n=1 Tax=Thermosynechococcus sp. HN-54 TaxID=2933959 RepID=UPI00202CF591|nr:pilus assembly PilX N-terminal domain-containing protein [Thermosynechococcus sp. HN-54]URR34710.1 pilus assembly PilX N-terminal domain-containing protein [Thermosynechococcus sp. HN-54]
MIKKLVRSLKRRYPHPGYRQRGFTLPLVLGMGLIMIVVALTLISRSQLDVSTASLQKQTQQAFAVAEGGMARTLGLLNGNYQILLRRTYNPATNTNFNPPRPYLIDRSTDATKIGQPNTSGLNVPAVNQWTAASLGSDAPPCFTLDNLNTIVLNGTIGTPVQGNYRILSYLYDAPTQTGHLLIEGRLPNNSPANAFILQKMVITDRSVPANFPGLLAQSINLGNNDVFGTVNGNVICTNPANCVVPQAECQNGQPTQQGLRSAVGALNNAIIEGTIAINKINLPPFPSAPNAVGGSVLGSVPLTTLPSWLPTSQVTDFQQALQAAGGYSQGAYANFPVPGIGNNPPQDRPDITGNTSNLTFPRPGDRPYVDPNPNIPFFIPDPLRPGERIVNPEKVYYAYRIRNINLSGNEKVTFNTSNYAIRLYVSGDISLSGQAGIDNTCSPNSSTCGTGANMGLPSGVGTPDRLRIYGNPPDPNNSTPDQSFTLSGGSTAGSVFIYAPDAQVGINGGSREPDIFGAVWAKTWNGSSSNNAEIRVPDRLPEALGGEYANASIVVARTTEASNWNRLAQY